MEWSVGDLVELVREGWSALRGQQPEVHAALIGAVATAVVGLAAVAAAILAPLAAWLTSVTILRRQIDHDRVERAKDRALEARREATLVGVTGITEITQAISMYSDFKTPIEVIRKQFLSGMAKVTGAGAVASLDAVRLGREFTELAGGAFVSLMAKRMLLGDAPSSDAQVTFSKTVLRVNVDIIQPASLAAIAAVRRDMGVPDEGADAFITAATTTVDGVDRSIARFWKEVEVPMEVPKFGKP